MVTSTSSVLLIGETEVVNIYSNELKIYGEIKMAPVLRKWGHKCRGKEKLMSQNILDSSWSQDKWLHMLKEGRSDPKETVGQFWTRSHHWMRTGSITCGNLGVSTGVTKRDWSLWAAEESEELTKSTRRFNGLNKNSVDSRPLKL